MKSLLWTIYEALTGSQHRFRVIERRLRDAEYNYSAVRFNRFRAELGRNA
jgi:hypothetical protein